MTMKSLDCPNCGDSANIQENQKIAFCESCGSSLAFDDGVQRVDIRHSGQIQVEHSSKGTTDESTIKNLKNILEEQIKLASRESDIKKKTQSIFEKINAKVGTAIIVGAGIAVFIAFSMLFITRETYVLSRYWFYFALAATVVVLALVVVPLLIYESKRKKSQIYQSDSREKYTIDKKLKELHQQGGAGPNYYKCGFTLGMIKSYISEGKAKTVRQAENMYDGWIASIGSSTSQSSSESTKTESSSQSSSSSTGFLKAAGSVRATYKNGSVSAGGSIIASYSSSGTIYIGTRMVARLDGMYIKKGTSIVGSVSNGSISNNMGSTVAYYEGDSEGAAAAAVALGLL